MNKCCMVQAIPRQPRQQRCEGKEFPVHVRIWSLVGHLGSRHCPSISIAICSCLLGMCHPQLEKHSLTASGFQSMLKIFILVLVQFGFDTMGNCASTPGSNAASFPSPHTLPKQLHLTSACFMFVVSGYRQPSLDGCNATWRSSGKAERSQDRRSTKELQLGNATGPSTEIAMTYPMWLIPARAARLQALALLVCLACPIL